MALNGTINGSTNNQYVDAKIVWSATQSVSGNYSDVTATLYYSRNNTGYTTYGTWSGGITINGTTTTGSKSISITYNSNTVAVSATTRVYHNNDGTKTITISAYGSISGTSLSSTSVSSSVALTTIPRASKIASFAGTDLAGNFSVSYTSYSSSFTNKLRISVPNVKSLETFNYTSGTSFKLSKTSLDYLYSYTSNTDKVKLGAVIETWNGNTKIGESSELINDCYVPSGIKPSIGDITLDPINITTNDGTSRNILVQDKNQISFSVSGCKAGTGSSIKNYKFEVLSGSTVIESKTTTSSSVTFGPFSNTGTLKFRLTVTDNRNRATSNKDKEPTWDCNAYDAPSFSSFTAYRCNSSGAVDNDGTYVKYSLSVSYSSVNSTNKSTVKIYYKNNTSSEWKPCKNALTDSTTKSAETLVKNDSGDAITFGLESTYSIRAEVIDNYNGNVYSSVVTIFSSERVFNIRASKKGIAFGKMAESDDLFECKWPMKIDNQLEFGSGMQGKLYTNSTDGKNIVYIQSGQAINGGTTMGLSLHAGGQTSDDTSSPSVYIENSANSGRVNLGSSGRKWNQLYATNGTINTSDRNKKTDIATMSDVQEKLFNELKPVTYKFIDGTSDRTHYGFISQDVEESLDILGLDGTDFAGFCKDAQVDEDGVEILDANGKNIYDYSLRYSEFIALNTHMIQKLQAEIIELKAIIEELKSTAQN